MIDYVENSPKIPPLPRQGERIEVRGKLTRSHPHITPSPASGRGETIFIVRGCPPGMRHSVEIFRLFTEFIPSVPSGQALSQEPRLFASLRVTGEGFRMTTTAFARYDTVSNRRGRSQGRAARLFLRKFSFERNEKISLLA